MNIIKAIGDENLFRAFLDHDLESWKAWGIALRALYGLPVKSDQGKQLVLEATGREAAQLPRSTSRL